MHPGDRRLSPCQMENRSSMTRILVVDDQDDIRRLLTLTLSGKHSIREAADADTAWRLLQVERFDIVILDVMMPGSMDGMDLCRRIKATSSLAMTKVLLVTARGQEADRAAGIAAGADNYYVKPFSPLALLRDIEGYVLPS